MRLLGLPMEFWLSTAIMAIAMEAGKLLVMDDFMDLLQKIGYARIQVEINVGLSLKPGVLIRGSILATFYLRKLIVALLSMWKAGTF